MSIPLLIRRARPLPVASCTPSTDASGPRRTVDSFFADMRECLGGTSEHWLRTTS